MMDYIQRKTRYLNLMKACLRTQAAGDATAALAAFGELEEFACAVAREFRDANDPKLKEDLAEVILDAVSFVERQAHSHNDAGDVKGARFLWASVKKIRGEAEEDR